ncbi:hypothetical protein BDA99DRAFT_496980 [Phascolomyces articulosus]|uniref:Uncharacterized protein n=1 Tax=Phascolomyces articulosus TaxID=60185 RepID=A0AAD5PJA8_9FUNG|nr:hypothetical protein BDA99DRAFT_496980 [Phascolomyces articulosus]
MYIFIYFKVNNMVFKRKLYKNNNNSNTFGCYCYCCFFSCMSSISVIIIIIMDCEIGLDWKRVGFYFCKLCIKYLFWGWNWGMH